MDRGGAAVADNDNTITLIGRIGQEPELRSTTKGDVCNFTVATSERRRAGDGSWSDGPTSWFRVAAWHDLARHAHASLHRGQQVIVRGVLTIAEFQLDSGARTRNAEVRATAVGHDLRWGTTTFADGRAAARTAVAPAEPDRGSEAAEPRERETVPAAAQPGWSSTFSAEDETPF
jgi:single-strand DNA-binding protein